LLGTKSTIPLRLNAMRSGASALYAGGRKFNLLAPTIINE